MKKHLLFSRVNPDGRTTVERRSNDGQSKGRYSVGLAKLLFTITLLLTLSVGQMWAWNPVYLIGDDAGNWTSGKTNYVISNNADEGSCYFYLTKNKYFAVYITYYNEQAGPGTDKSEMGINSGSQKFYIWGDGENNHSAKYTGKSGIVEVHAKQKDNGDDQPWIWLTRPTVYIRHKWNNSSWSNQPMTDNNDGTYKYKGQYSGTSSTNVGPCSSCTDGGAKFKYFTVTPVGSPSAGDYCLFEYNSSGFKGFGTQSQNTGTLTITKLCGLTYDGNGSTGGTAVPSALSDQKCGSSVTLSSAAMTKTGYTLTGWNTANDGSGTHYDLGASFTFSDKSNTLYAEWTQTITIDVNTGTSAGSMSIYFNAGSLKSFTAATKDDWILDSYWTSADESGSKVINYDATTGAASLESNVTNYTSNTGKWTRTAATTLFAHWKQTYRVTYNANYPASATSNSGTVPTDATEYEKNATVIVKTNSGSLAAGGYTFAGWQTEPTGGTSYGAGSGTFSITEPTTLYAKWTENKRNVTISAGTGGTVDKTSESVGVATTTTVAATAYPGYKFTGWTATNCSVASTSSASTTLSGDGTTGAATLVANFARTYAYLEGRMTVYNAARSTKTHIASSEGGWDVSSTRIKMDYDETNHRFYRHTYMTPKELSTEQSSNEQYFFFKTSTSSSSLANEKTHRPSTGRTLTAAGTENKKETGSSTGSNSIWFNSSDASGYVVIYFDEAGVWYELEQSLIYHANYAASGTSGTAPATEYYPNGFAATAAEKGDLTMTNYTFSGWNTDEHITGTSYAVGSSITMNANKDLYAVWKRSIPMDDQDATTGVSNTVYGTYNCTTLSEYNNPEKTGYTFNGWYTQEAGGGNYVISPEKELQPGVYHWTNYDNNTNEFMRYPTSTSSLYAKWTQTVTLNANTSYHGSGDNTTATIVYKATAKTSITHCTPATGYQLEGYYTAATGGTKILNADGGFAGSNITVDAVPYISGGAWVKAGATTLYAHYTAKTYDVILDVNGATTGSNQTVVATFDAAMPTVCSDGTTPLAEPSKTGYTFGGYWTNNTGTGTQYYTNALASNHIWDVATNNTHIYAKWTANGYRVTLDVDEANQGTIAGATLSQDVTFDAATTTVPNRPTAANGYALDGYYTDQLGEGKKVINGDGTWIASVAGYTDGSKNWVHDGDVTLYAYFKKAEITNLVAAPGVIAPSETITITPTISPAPTGTTKVCYELQYNNGTPLPSQPTFTPGVGNAVSFEAPAASATYRLQATLKTGSSCAGGTELSVYSTTFQVAGEHIVTVQYQDGDGRTLKDTIHITGKPLDWTTAGAITPPTITGYTFARWDAGDGVSIKNGASETTTTTTSSIQIKAVYDGTLTAVYNKRNLIYFNNTLGWEHVYVYFYSTSDYWTSGSGSNTGTGANKEWNFGGKTPYYREFHGEMTRIEGTNIYYWDFMAEARKINPSYGYEIDNADNVAFTKDNQHNYSYFYNTEAVRRGDFNHSLSMFVPLADQTPDMHNGTKYYSSGYWMNYPENTGYDLLIYNQKTKDGATKLYEIPFEYTEDYTMPMELVVDLEAGQTYGFEIKRADGKYYSTTTTITANTSNWGLYKDQTSYCGLQTTAAGDYTFSLFYDGEYRVGVTYPVAVYDWRIVYTDLATWSKGAHTASWNHPSGVITKNGSATAVKKDTVSFFWSYGSSPAIKYQKCTSTGTGSVTWNAGTAISVSDFSSVLTKSGVYNFIFEQPAGGASISLVGVEPYTGNYYIRTDCAGATKWANFQSLDHQMTYSDYAAAKSAAAGNTGFTHYYAHWATTGQNVKFVIANDYSQCITDTLIEDIGTVVANITTEGNSNAGRLNSGNASIRFMWNIITNKLSRAYIAGSSVITDRFLVLEGDAKMYDENGNALTGENRDHNKEGNVFLDQDNQVVLHDDENFVYERTIQVNTTARAKLTAKYNSNVQYFKGSEGAFAEGTTVELLGGSASGKHRMRIVYDFKTNRLVTAYLPSTTIEEPLAINADLMLVREHQNAGEQITFTGSGALSDVHTVYGVMRFNRWTLNNKETTGGHSPVGDPKSAYERGLYWISFPFDVNLSDVFGFGTYGTHWIIMEYDGAERASKGYWKDSPTFWRYVTNRTNKVLEAGKGYVLALDLDLMRDNDATFWSNNIEQVELFFPSTENVGAIEATNVTTSVESHACTIDRTEPKGGADINKNRTKADSHWNIIGIPSYANYGSTLTSDGSTVVTWNSSPYTNDLPFLYEWNTVDNTYTVQSGTTYPFKSMHAYMVQYHGDLFWSLASAKPSSIVARRANTERPENVEFRIELQQNDKMIDQTFVKLSNDENVSANFSFDEDLCKEYNGTKANIYTIVENYIPTAGNTLPMSEQTTVIPVGVKIAADGDYTFAVPDGTNGVGVTLIDTETGVRTSLSALDYTINLSAGTYDSRFVMEISPIQQISTDIENSEISNQNLDVRKVMIDQIMYIIKDGKMYDARGARVQ